MLFTGFIWNFCIGFKNILFFMSLIRLMPFISQNDDFQISYMICDFESALSALSIAPPQFIGATKCWFDISKSLIFRHALLKIILRSACLKFNFQACTPQNDFVLILCLLILHYKKVSLWSGFSGILSIWKKWNLSFCREKRLA